MQSDHSVYLLRGSKDFVRDGFVQQIACSGSLAASLFGHRSVVAEPTRLRAASV